MGIVLLIVGVVIALAWSLTLGIVLIIVGFVLTFVPAVPYGYAYWRDRRRPAP